MKIAVIGTGIAGNVASYHLSKQHDVTVYEANDHIGGHTHTHQIASAGRTYPIDTGFIVFNRRTYPHFIALLEELNVESRPTEMSFSVKSESNGLEYSGSNINTLFAQRLNLIRPSFYRMLMDIKRFNTEAVDFMAESTGDIELGDFLREGDYGKEFIEHYILPMGAAIWSSDTLQMLRFPARFFIRFFHHHGLLSINERPQWYVIKNGSHEYVKKLVSGFENNIRLSLPVRKVRRKANSVEICTWEHEAQNFDAVFIATHSDQALTLLDDPTPDEREVLGTFKYQTNHAVLHTDIRLLPKRPLAWASWNYHIPKIQSGHVSVTYNMNILQGIDAEQTFCVTLNNNRTIDERHIIRQMTYDHPVFTLPTLKAQKRQHDINGVKRTFYCGAYWRNGFHEDGVVSALNALSDFNEFLRNEQLPLRRAG